MQNVQAPGIKPEFAPKDDKPKPIAKAQIDST